MTARHPGSLAGQMRRQLNEPELAVLASLQRLRLLTTAQVQRLHLVDGPAGSNLRRAQYLLRRLHQLKLVKRLSRIIGGRRGGSAGVVYGLSGFGLAVLMWPEELPLRQRRDWNTRPYFQDHMLAVSELYVCLVERAHQGLIDDLVFTAEPACWRSFGGLGGELLILKPDAYVRLLVGEAEIHAFIEVDLGTEHMPTIQRKAERYLAYWRSGIEQQRTRSAELPHGLFPFVVWLVPDELRRASIQRVLGRLAARASGLFRVGLLEDGAEVLSEIPAGSPEADGETNPRAPP